MNCMNEVLNLKQDDEYKSRMVLLVHKSAKIYSTKAATEYLKYWKDQLELLQTNTKTQEIESAGSLQNTIQIHRNIVNSIVSFIENDLRNTLVPPWNELQKKQFFPIFKWIAKQCNLPNNH